MARGRRQSSEGPFRRPRQKRRARVSPASLNYMVGPRALQATRPHVGRTSGARRARVVGVNTAIIPIAQGIGFAVPGNTARWVIGEFLTHGRVRRLSLGVSATAVELPRRIVRELDLLTERAVQAVEIISGGPGHAAGLARGDLIVAVNARVVTGVDDLHRLLTEERIGELVPLKILRRGELRRVLVTPREVQ